MLWVIIGESSHEIISCNIGFADGKHAIWVERPNGKSLKISEGERKADVMVIKEAIDYAIQHGHKTLNLNN